MAVIYSTSLVDYGMNRVFMVAGIYTYRLRQQERGKNVAQMAVFRVPVTILTRI
jgi:hypothetical protein